VSDGRLDMVLCRPMKSPRSLLTETRALSYKLAGYLSGFTRSLPKYVTFHLEEVARLYHVRRLAIHDQGKGPEPGNHMHNQPREGA
jgi:hypothetical protein